MDGASAFRIVLEDDEKDPNLLGENASLEANDTRARIEIFHMAELLRFELFDIILLEEVPLER